MNNNNIINNKETHCGTPKTMSRLLVQSAVTHRKHSTSEHSLSIKMSFP